ncbi:cystathionine gamma-synthase [Rhodohalobacter sp.]|uniref:cystathionine gamma-synthase n=1 Tax=Rhodohalobacter sp. TaxID=1974210 RepID=UPI002ACE8E35|nr:cystathionine gamma-synthase [Rhodohalobacter sp.]MDZ7757922.1 cystathionine gamma-synthase [Rhodohalobacter sp.]
MKFNTKAIHAGQKPEETTGAVMPPIFQTSTYAQKAPNDHQGYDYARVGNPTRTALEKMIAGLEEADEGICFSSGVAAIDAIMKTLRPGDHVISTNDLYGGTYRLFTQIFENYGIEFSFVDMTNIDEVEKALQENTKLVWMETPTNPLLRIIDIKAVTELTKSRNILSVVDNTFASPYLQRPLTLGADAVMHSTTKYLGGHSDAIGGAVATSNKDLIEKLRFQIKTCGAVPGPMDCYLILRGIKTLSVRVERSVENAKKIASHLIEHAKVGEVFYPGLDSHPQHKIAAKQMDDFGAMVSFSLKDDSIEKASEFMSKTGIFTLAESLGGVESLISHPASMTHGSIPKDVREKAGLKDSLIRLSVGIEDVDDLIDDLNQAF